MLQASLLVEVGTLLKLVAESHMGQTCLPKLVLPEEKPLIEGGLMKT